jgi:uncharacterized membrane protein
VFTKIRQYILAGVLTVIPIWVTWLVFSLLLGKLSQWGDPVAGAMARSVSEYAPRLGAWLSEPWFNSAIAVLWTVAALYVIGWVATKVIGQRIISAFDALIDRIPLAQTIYGATKRLVAALQRKPDGVHRVVLLEFPSSGMKAVGFVTRTFADRDTGEELAAVYVPTTPNPTSGYLEIVPLAKLVSTNWNMDDAMSFIMSGGAVAPETVSYSRSASRVGTPDRDEGGELASAAREAATEPLSGPAVPGDGAKSGG